MKAPTFACTRNTQVEFFLGDQCVSEDANVKCTELGIVSGDLIIMRDSSPAERARSAVAAAVTAGASSSSHAQPPRAEPRREPTRETRPDDDDDVVGRAPFSGPPTAEPHTRRPHYDPGQVIDENLRGGELFRARPPMQRPDAPDFFPVGPEFELPGRRNQPDPNLPRGPMPGPFSGPRHGGGGGPFGGPFI